MSARPAKRFTPALSCVLFAVAHTVGCSSGDGVHPPSRPKPMVDHTPTKAASKLGTLDPTLPDRDTFFGNPERVSPEISPDGRWLSWIAPTDGVMNVWVAPIDAPAAARPVTHERTRGLHEYRWLHQRDHLAYFRDEDGDENRQLFSLDVTKNETPRPLTPKGARAELLMVSPRAPNRLLAMSNDRTPDLMDVYDIDVRSGARKLVVQNDLGFFGYLADRDLAVRVGYKLTPAGRLEWHARSARNQWSLVATIDPEDIFTTTLLSADSAGIYAFDSRGRDKSALFRWAPTTDKWTLLGEGRRADVDNVMVHPATGAVLGYAETYLRTEWTFFDDQIQRDFVALGKLAAGEPSIVSRTTDDRLWLVELRRDDGPEAYYLYDRNRGEGRPLFTSRRELQDVTLVPMRPVEIPARDGRVLPSYLSLPAGSTAQDGSSRKRVPLVLRVHGGPWWRDSWGYDPFHQWLASRGYAVLSVNFRGSAGFGKSFLNAGDREWAGRMHDDLVDAAAWAVAQGYTSNDTIAIYGASYGGYAALVGLTFTPRTFACAIDVVGPSNLVTFIENAPPYWAPLLPVLNTKLADPTTPDGREWLLGHSPLSFVDRIERPLLIGHGANDPRVKEKESRQIVDAMVKRQIPVTFVRFPDEGHGFERPENLKAFTGIAEAFLASCLGGRYSALGADTLRSSAEVPVGAEEIPGLTEALAERARSREPVQPRGAGTRDH